MKIPIHSRREALKISGLAGISTIIPTSFFSAILENQMNKRIIPSTGKSIPIVGLGTWQTFDVYDNISKRKTLSQVLAEMHKKGGSIIDSSPMYGSSERVVGDLTADFTFQDEFFYATKVWTSGKESGIDQMNSSMRKMKRKEMSLIQIHNLLDWKTHVKTLKEWKEKGKIKYWGITHYVDSSHAKLESIIKSEKPDFVQFNYSIRSRHAEKSLFETTRKNGTAVIINQPFESGSLFRITKGKSLPGWSQEYGINSWGQYFLKFILSNKNVTCVIPGTSKPHHVVDNMLAGYGVFPDEKRRELMYKHLQNI